MEFTPEQIRELRRLRLGALKSEPLSQATKDFARSVGTYYDDVLDLAEQALLMKAALSPERAEEIAASMETGYGMADHLEAYAKVARGEK